MTSPEIDLANLRDGDKRDPAPFRLKLDTGLSIEAPSARRLAEVFALPALAQRNDVFRCRAELHTRPKGSLATPQPLALKRLAAALRRKIGALPERGSSEAGRPYRDVRLLVLEAEPATVEAYLLAVAKAVRTLAPIWRPPAEKVERDPAKTTAERKAAQRGRERTVEELVALEWLKAYIDEEAAPGARVAAVELYAAALAAVDEYIDADETLNDGTPYRRPRRTIFYATADDLLGKRRRTAAGYLYAIPEPSPVSIPEEELVTPEQIREEAAAYREAAEAGEHLLRVRKLIAVGDYRTALNEHRDRHAASGGTVVDLSAARTRRGA